MLSLRNRLSESSHSSQAPAATAIDLAQPKPETYFPIQFLIVITSSSTVLKTNKQSSISYTVTHLFNLEEKIKQLSPKHPIQNSQQ
jgi:hypothetical protein